MHTDSTAAARALAALIASGHAHVGVIGLGYVGLPLARAFTDAGLRVTGFDIDAAKTKALNRGECYLKHLGPTFVEGLRGGHHFEATADFSRLDEPDALIMCVPTPLGPHREPDLRFVERTTDAIAACLRPAQLVVLESTTYPGTSRSVVAPRLERTGLAVGRDVFLAYSPERHDPGRDTHTTRTTPRIVGGLDPISGELATALYRRAIDDVHDVRSAEVAEAAKLLENVFRAVNIALVNETKVVLDALDINIWDVLDAASTKPFGFMPFFPGPGLGGHCIPIDPYYLTWKAKEAGLSTRFIELAGEVNRQMPEYVVSRVVRALNDDGLAPSRARILVLGLAYKPDVDDTRESPSFEIISLLRELGSRVDYHDPLIPRTQPTRRHDLRLECVTLTPETLASYDCAVVCTNHSAYDWDYIGRHAKLIVDTRNALRGIDAKARIVRA